ncbi:hypothetical protein [Streptomyces sp. NPDC006638]|uniref:hypothetical protein n=1 Tax=Streptomyces sp. NPDC006638 TaxID=3157183 RepID=UPI00339F391F
MRKERVQTDLSGRSLIVLLPWNTRSTATPLQGDWALAMTSYSRIATELAGIDAGKAQPSASSSTTPPRSDV